MLKFILQSAKLCISFHNLTALCEQTSWLTHVANDHVIDLLYHAMPSLTILKQALSILLWLIVHDFLQATKINCQNVTFSPMQTRWSSPMKTMQEFKFLAFVNIFFLQTRDRKKKNCFEHRTMKKTKERLCEIYQNLLKPSWSRKTKESGLPV